MSINHDSNLTDVETYKNMSIKERNIFGATFVPYNSWASYIINDEYEDALEATYNEIEKLHLNLFNIKIYNKFRNQKTQILKFESEFSNGYDGFSKKYLSEFFNIPISDVSEFVQEEIDYLVKWQKTVLPSLGWTNR